MKKFIAVMILAAVIMPSAALAQTTNACKPVAGAVTAPQDRIGECVNQVYKWSLGAAGILALLMIVFGGYQVMTAGGNAQRATSGRSFIYSSLIGLAILLGAFLLINTINPDLTQLKIETPCPGTGGFINTGSGCPPPTTTP
jgi:hypothetical protein